MNYRVKPGFADEWMNYAVELTAAVRVEAGNKWPEWSRSVEDPNQYILVEALDDDAGGAHVDSEHFAEGPEATKPLPAKTPKTVLQVLPDKWGWGRIGELQVD